MSSNNNKNFNHKYIIIIVICLVIATSLIFLIKHFMSGPEEPDEPDKPIVIVPISADNLKFRGFQSSGDQVTKPWCVATEYAYKYVSDGMESRISPFIRVPTSLTESNPMIQVTLVPNINIQMYRKLDGLAAIGIESTFDKDGIFIDYDNPCQEDFKIPAPEKRMDPIGGEYREKVGTLGSFDKIAQANESPWCVGTSYVYKYIKDGKESDPSPVSIVVKSLTYTEPVFNVVLNSEYDIQILRSIDNSVTFSPVINQIIDEDGYFVDTDNICTMMNPLEKAPEFLGYTYKN